MSKSKILIPIAAVVASVCFAAPTYADDAASHFTDDTFLNCALTTTSKTESTLTFEDLAGIDHFFCEGDTMANTDGLELMTGLTSLSLHFASGLSSIDLSHNTSLKELEIRDAVNLTQIDLSNNTALDRIILWKDGLTSLDLSHNTALRLFAIHYTNISSLDISGKTELVDLNVANNDSLATLNASNNPKLINFSAADSSKLSSIDLSGDSALRDLYLKGTNLISLDLSDNTALTAVHTPFSLAELDVTNNTALASIFPDNHDMIVKGNITRVEGADTEQYDLSQLEFTASPYIISDSNDYTYDYTTQIMTVTKAAGTEVLAPVIDINNNNEVLYKLLIRYANPVDADEEAASEDKESIPNNPATFDNVQAYILAAAALSASLAAVAILSLIEHAKNQE